MCGQGVLFLLFQSLSIAIGEDKRFLFEFGIPGFLSSTPLSEYPQALCGHFHFWNWGHTHNLPVSHTPTTSPCLTHHMNGWPPKRKKKKIPLNIEKKYECDLACKMVADKDWMVSNHISTEPCVFFFVVTVVPCLTTIHFLSYLSSCLLIWIDTVLFFNYMVVAFRRRWVSWDPTWFVTYSIW